MTTDPTALAELIAYAERAIARSTDTADALDAARAAAEADAEYRRYYPEATTKENDR